MNIEQLEQFSPWKEKIFFFKSIDSTNNYALQLGESGVAEGTIVIADEQKWGRGQFQRSWLSPEKLGLWMSLVLRPMITPKMIPALSQFAVVALYDAILKMKIEVHDMKIKPPNDLLIAGKKVAGILVETRLGKNSFAVVGIGLNLFQQEKDFPSELKEKVTSLALATGEKNLDRSKILIFLLKELYERYQQLLQQPAELDLAWKARLT